MSERILLIRCPIVERARRWIGRVEKSVELSCCWLEEKRRRKVEVRVRGERRSRVGMITTKVSEGVQGQVKSEERWNELNSRNNKTTLTRRASRLVPVRALRDWFR